MKTDPEKRYFHGGNIWKLASDRGIREEDIIDFSASINPLGPPDYLRAVISSNLSKIHHYPDPSYSSFIDVIAKQFAIKAEQIVIGNGSTEIIFALPRALPVKRALIIAPAYVGYQEALQSVGLPHENIVVDETSNFEIQWSTLNEKLKDGDLVFLGQPNNPTGKLFSIHEFCEIAERFPRVYFVIDEAFADFVEGYDTAIGICDQMPNVIVLRSMTKFYAIPGLRLGFAVAAEKQAALIRELLPPWSVNNLALSLGEKVLTDKGYAKKSRSYVVEQRQWLMDELSSTKGIQVFDSSANYLLVKIVGEQCGLGDVGSLPQLLIEQGIAIRQCSNFEGLDSQFFRIAVRTKKENTKLVAALSSVLGFPNKKSVPARKPAIMFQGTCSDAGKSILTAALCRILFQDGIKVAPFKSQNMSLNSFVTHEGLEMGRAQVVQAQASKLDPDCRMNPILLKPSSDVGSQVIVNGIPVGNMTVDEYVQYKPQAFIEAKKAYDSLADEFDAIILEGAGSPAEVNLKSHDIVNMHMAKHANSPVILVGDIDRGGVFASFVGTMEVLAEWERSLVAGFLVNRFRGQESLLGDAFDYTLLHTGRPVLGVVPYLKNLGLPEEDSVSFKKGLYDQPLPSADYVEIALIDLPHISNFTDFEPFLAEPDVHISIIKEASQLDRPAAVILPGSKNVISDLDYLKNSGLADKIFELSQNGDTEIIGICGGYQILGHEISDPHHIESTGSRYGLGLLPLTTVLDKDKTLTRQTLVHIESGHTVYGYEIHHGLTSTDDNPLLKALDGTVVSAGAVKGRVWGSYLHGIFDADSFRSWFIDRLRQHCGLSPFQGERAIYDLEPAFDRLAATVRDRIDMKVIYQLLGI